MKRTKTTLKSYFETGDKPTQTQYEHLIDSLRHLDDKIPLTDLEEEVAKKDEDNNFSTLQTFDGEITANGGIRINNIANTPVDTDLKIVPHGTGNIHFGNSADGNRLFHYSHLNDGKYTSFSHNSTQSIFDTTSVGGFSFEKKVEFNDEGVFEGLVNANAGINTFSDNLDGSEALRIGLDGGRDWVFKQKGSGSATSLELRSTQNKDYYHYSTASIFKSSLDESSHLTLNHQNKTADLIGSLYVTGLITANSGIKVNQTIETPTNVNLNIIPNGTGNIYFGNSTNGNNIYHYSHLNDGKYTSFSHNSTQSVFDTTSISGFLFEKKITVNGDIQTSGNYISSDGTPGYNGNFTVGVYDITVKDGLITNVVNIS